MCQQEKRTARSHPAAEVKNICISDSWDRIMDQLRSEGPSDPIIWSLPGSLQAQLEQCAYGHDQLNLEFGPIVQGKYYVLILVSLLRFLAELIVEDLINFQLL